MANLGKQEYRNINFIQEMSGLSPWDFSSWRIVQEIQNTAVPPNNEWRLTWSSFGKREHWDQLYWKTLAVSQRWLTPSATLERFSCRVAWGPTLAQYYQYKQEKLIFKLFKNWTIRLCWIKINNRYTLWNPFWLRCLNLCNNKYLIWQIYQYLSDNPWDYH